MKRLLEIYVFGLWDFCRRNLLLDEDFYFCHPFNYELRLRLRLRLRWREKIRPVGHLNCSLEPLI